MQAYENLMYLINKDKYLKADFKKEKDVISDCTLNRPSARLKKLFGSINSISSSQNPSSVCVIDIANELTLELGTPGGQMLC